RATGQESVRLCWAAVVVERVEARIGAYVGRQVHPARVAVLEVVPVRNERGGAVLQGRKVRDVLGDDRALGCDTLGIEVAPSAAALANVESDSAVLIFGSALVVEQAAAVKRPVATDRAVDDRQCAHVLDTAALSAGSLVAADGAAIDDHRRLEREAVLDPSALISA